MTGRRGDPADRSGVEPPIEVAYAPRGGHERPLPVEVLERSALLPRVLDLSMRERIDFHQLTICTSGSGSHQLDYEDVAMTPGTILRAYPGQVHRYSTDPAFDGLVVIWPEESNHTPAGSERWFPGSKAAVTWHPPPEALERLVESVEALRSEQERFDGSQRHLDLMRAMLCVLLLRLAHDVPASSVEVGSYPVPYVAFRQLLESELFARPTVSVLARRLGYSTRTLDRACLEVSGVTAKQVLDERVAFEVRRLLTHSERPLARIAADFGFTDQSNFSKFVKRSLGSLPTEVRSTAGRKP